MDFDDERAVRLLTPLRQEPRRPSTVDVRRAVVRGERRRVTLRVASAAVVVLAVLVGGWAVAAPEAGPKPAPRPAASGSRPSGNGPSSPATGLQCTASALEMPANAMGEGMVTGADPSGRYSIGEGTGLGAGQTLLWDDTKSRVVDGPNGLVLEGVNAHGVAVGATDVKKHVPWVVQDGVARLLAHPDGVDARPYAINGKGQIAGSIHNQPVLWPGPDAAPVPLRLPGPGYSGVARGIDEDGTVVGELLNGDRSAAYAWSPDGTPKMLPAPVLDGRPATNYGADQVRNGWASGRVGQAWAVWNLVTGEVRVVTGGMLAMVNGAGWTLESPTDTEASIDTGAGRVALPAVGGKAPFAIQPVALSDDGHVAVGTAITEQNGRRAPVRWVCR
ncbi:hypothetical protein AB0M46_19830 [Dactylosporangium sp. NPDC051485]|uniref:hypothetical protein n=1 Tax=Dactylosporangium sp. NPDC051485 TaxID=3154846 RepID=UPI0034140132